MGGPPRGLGWVGRPSRSARRGQEALLEGRVCQEALPESRSGREALPKGQEGLGDTSREPGEVERPSQRVGRGLGIPSRWPGLWKPSQKGREEFGVLNKGQEGSQGPPRGQVGVGRTTRSAGRDQEALP